MSSRDSSTNPISVADADMILIGNERTENAFANLINFANARAYCTCNANGKGAE